jgi:hypothetical protein
MTAKEIYKSLRKRPWYIYPETLTTRYMNVLERALGFLLRMIDMDLASDEAKEEYELEAKKTFIEAGGIENLVNVGKRLWGPGGATSDEAEFAWLRIVDSLLKFTTTEYEDLVQVVNAIQNEFFPMLLFKACSCQRHYCASVSGIDAPDCAGSADVSTEARRDAISAALGADCRKAQQRWGG